MRYFFLKGHYVIQNRRFEVIATMTYFGGQNNIPKKEIFFFRNDTRHFFQILDFRRPL